MGCLFLFFILPNIQLLPGPKTNGCVDSINDVPCSMLSYLSDSVQNRLIQSHCVSFTNYVLYCSLILIYKFCQVQIYSKPHFILHFTECQTCNPRRTASRAMFSFMSVCIVSAFFSVASALATAQPQAFQP